MMAHETALSGAMTMPSIAPIRSFFVVEDYLSKHLAFLRSNP